MRTPSAPVITIRPADPADAEDLVRLGAEVGKESGRWLLTVDGWRTVSDERRYLKLVRKSRDNAVFVAVDDAAVVGRLSIARDAHPASTHVADLGLMVAASHRRRGIGRGLLDQAVAWASSHGVEKLELHVFPWNEPAIRLYESYGFEREGYRIAHYRRKDERLDVILMAFAVPP